MNMVEQMARALFEYQEQNLPPGVTWRVCEREARVAVETMGPVLAALKLARQEIEWWAAEHPCCRGRETIVLDIIDEALRFSEPATT